MSITLHNLHPNEGATKPKKRLGRGRGSGTGKTSGKGVKGQKARPGHHGARLGFEGGQVPMVRRIPKRGFKNPFRVEAFPINVATLDKVFDAGSTIDVDALRSRGLLPKTADCVKIRDRHDGDADPGWYAAPSDTVAREATADELARDGVKP
jgi:large subunit ribosomal protein L15